MDQLVRTERLCRSDDGEEMADESEDDEGSTKSLDDIIDDHAST